MKVVAEIEIPDGWFRAPNARDRDTVWEHVPAEPDRPFEVMNEGTVPHEAWVIVRQVVPAACPSHPLTPGYFPCGNVCALGHTKCPVPPRVHPDDPWSEADRG